MRHMKSMTSHRLLPLITQRPHLSLINSYWLSYRYNLHFHRNARLIHFHGHVTTPPVNLFFTTEQQK